MNNLPPELILKGGGVVIYNTVVRYNAHGGGLNVLNTSKIIKKIERVQLV